MKKPLRFFRIIDTDITLYLEVRDRKYISDNFDICHRAKCYWCHYVQNWKLKNFVLNLACYIRWITREIRTNKFVYVAAILKLEIRHRLYSAYIQMTDYYDGQATCRAYIFRLPEAKFFLKPRRYYGGPDFWCLQTYYILRVIR